MGRAIILKPTGIYIIGIKYFMFQVSRFKFHGQLGFTLIELVVVLAIFMLMIGVAVSMFTSIIQHQKRILENQELLNQASYATEYITRALRTPLKDAAGSCLFDGALRHPGAVYLLTHQDTASGFYQGIKLVNRDGTCQEFFLDKTDGRLKEIKNGASAEALISEKFTLAYFRFIINGDKNIPVALAGSPVQPRLTMALDIKTKTPGNQNERVFQTTVSQRNQ